uniref:F-box/LRR-repeat protein 15/At3g58940/PEG3-like LRR domain-containing protein n=1 Tax=Oryza glaberrima TaxID=4538 RepID=I1PWI3_ORYGL
MSVAHLFFFFSFLLLLFSSLLQLVGGGDRLSALSDGVIGHILSFLPANEAARAAVFSPRWHHTFTAVHTVYLVEPDAPVVDHDELAKRQFEPQKYSVLRGLFTCAVLRSLSLGSVRLTLPAAIALPSLETLLLADVTDHERNMQRLISGCPRPADLTLEACYEMAPLSVAGLALRCCHGLDTVVLDDMSSPSELLQAFELQATALR